MTRSVASLISSMLMALDLEVFTICQISLSTIQLGSRQNTKCTSILSVHIQYKFTIEMNMYCKICMSYIVVNSYNFIQISLFRRVAVLLRLAARIADSFIKFSRSAPLKPAVPLVSTRCFSDFSDVSCQMKNPIKTDKRRSNKH